MNHPSNKDKILQQIKLLANQYELQDLTVRQICDRAGVSIGSFYHHFASKDDLIVHLFLRNADALEPLVETEFNSPSAWDDLRRYIQFQIDSTYSTSIEQLKYLYTYDINHQGFPMERYRELVRTILARAREKGQMNDRYTDEQILDHLFSLILGNLIRYCIENGDYDLRDKLTFQVNSLISLISQ